MRIGKLDRRIVIQRSTRTTDAFNAPILTWATLATVWASYSPLSDGEKARVAEVSSDIMARFVIRYATALAALDTRDQIVFDGRTWNVIGVKELGRKDGLEITAKGAGRAGMSGVVTVSVEGLRELDKALGELESKALAKGVLRRVLLKAGQPMADMANSLAPNDPKTPAPDLHTSVLVSAKLNKSQAKAARKEGKSFQEVYVGTSDRAGVLQEFGTSRHRAQPFMRPAFDATKDAALNTIKHDLGTEIEKTAARAAKRKAAKAAKLAGA